MPTALNVLTDSGWRSYLREEFSHNSEMVFPGLHGGTATLIDFSGKGHTGTITGATWKRLKSGLWYLDFQTADNRVSIPNSANFDLTADFALSMWIRNDATTSYRDMIGTLDAGWMYYLNSASRIPEFYSGVTTYTATTAPTVGANSHIGLTRIGNDWTFWLNGATNGTFTRLNPTASVNPLLIGNRSDLTGDFQGMIALPKFQLATPTSMTIPVIFQRTRHLFGV